MIKSINKFKIDAKILEANEKNMNMFVKSAYSADTLIHKSDRDFWRLSDDGKSIIKLVDEDIIEESVKKEAAGLMTKEADIKHKKWQQMLNEFDPDNKKNKHLPKDDSRVKDEIYIVTAVRNMILDNKTNKDIVSYLSKQVVDYKNCLDDIKKLSQERGLLGKVYIEPTFFDCSKSELRKFRSSVGDKCKIVCSDKCKNCTQLKSVGDRAICADINKTIIMKLAYNVKVLNSHLNHIQKLNPHINLDDLRTSDDKQVKTMLRKAYIRLENFKFDKGIDTKIADDILNRHETMLNTITKQDKKEADKIQKATRKIEAKLYKTVAKAIKKKLPIRDIGLNILARDKGSIIKRALEDLQVIDLKCFSGCEDKLLKNSRIKFKLANCNMCQQCRNNLGDKCKLNGRPFEEPYVLEVEDKTMIPTDMDNGTMIKVPKGFMDLDLEDSEAYVPEDGFVMEDYGQDVFMGAFDDNNDE